MQDIKLELLHQAHSRAKAAAGSIQKHKPSEGV